VKELKTSDGKDEKLKKNPFDENSDKYFCIKKSFPSSHYYSIVNVNKFK
jgi:hypothetical protein